MKYVFWIYTNRSSHSHVVYDKSRREVLRHELVNNESHVVNFQDNGYTLFIAKGKMEYFTIHEATMTPSEIKEHGLQNKI